MAPQPHFQGKKKHKGRKRRRYKKTMIYQLYQYLLDPGLLKKIVSQTDQSVTTFFMKKKCHLEFKEGSPPQIATLTIKAVMALTMYDIHPYSMYRFLQLSTDGSPNTHLRKKKKARGGREEDTSK